MPDRAWFIIDQHSSGTLLDCEESFWSSLGHFLPVKSNNKLFFPPLLWSEQLEAESYEEKLFITKRQSNKRIQNHHNGQNTTRRKLKTTRKQNSLAQLRTQRNAIQHANNRSGIYSGARKHEAGTRAKIVWQ